MKAVFWFLFGVAVAWWGIRPYGICPHPITGKNALTFSLTAKDKFWQCWRIKQ